MRRVGCSVCVVFACCCGVCVVFVRCCEAMACFGGGEV